MNRIQLGCQLPQEIGDFRRLLEVARECERLGYDSVWAYDHLSPWWVQSHSAFECWTLLAAIAARTSNIKIGSLVTNINLRNPALLAKMTSTIDNISGGRLIVGLGTGDRLSRAELLSYGYAFAPLQERVQCLRETVSILKSLWTENETSHDGKSYVLRKAINFPKPKQSPHPPIWIGGRHKEILDVVAEMADGWNYWDLDKNTLTERSQYLTNKLSQIGRSRDEITKSWAGDLLISRDAHIGEVVTRIRERIDPETRYLIASLGPEADSRSYEIFANAVRAM